MPARMIPTHGTVGVRKDARRQVRNVLGTGRDDAPDALDAITAAQHLDKILRAASDGELRLVIKHDPHNAGWSSQLSWLQARQLARGEAVER